MVVVSTTLNRKGDRFDTYLDLGFRTELYSLLRYGRKLHGKRAEKCPNTRLNLPMLQVRVRKKNQHRFF